MQTNQVNIIAYPRLHISLIGMNQDGYRINGGIGFSIEVPQIKISCVVADNYSLEDFRGRKISNDENQRIKLIIEEISQTYQIKNSISAKLTGDTGNHLGFGTGTSIRLAIIESLFILNNIPYTEELILKLSKRGGTSGVGVNTYFKGGLILDIGRKKENDIFLPSSMNENSTIPFPLFFKRILMPDWQIGLCIPNYINSKTEQEEKYFFEKTCPIKDSEVHKTLYHIIYGLAASTLENDFNTFNESIKAIQECAWKKSERALYGNELLEIESLLYQNGASAVGMSSLGPLLFFTSKNIENVINIMRSLRSDLSLYSSKPINHGRIINYD